MRVDRVVMHSSTSATVYLQPSWWERLWGEKRLVCELERRKDDDEQGALTWRSKHTGERMEYMYWGSLMRRALAFQPLADDVELPAAKALHDGR